MSSLIRAPLTSWKQPVQENSVNRRSCEDFSQLFCSGNQCVRVCAYVCGGTAAPPAGQPLHWSPHFHQHFQTKAAAAAARFKISFPGNDHLVCLLSFWRLVWNPGRASEAPVVFQELRFLSSLQRLAVPLIFFFPVQILKTQSCSSLIHGDDLWWKESKPWSAAWSQHVAQTLISLIRRVRSSKSHLLPNITFIMQPQTKYMTSVICFTLIQIHLIRCKNKCHW